MTLAARHALVFPGQGSQKVGMGRAWVAVSPAARRVFEEADRVLAQPLSRLCWEGPEEALAATANTQPALLTTSIAILRALRERGDLALAPVAMAGHSLGEYSALVAAEALDFADALRLVRRRGELMQQAVPLGEGAMAAILGLPADQVAALVADSAAPAQQTEPAEKTAPAESASGAGGGAAVAAEVCAVANLNGPGQTVIAGHTAAVERAMAFARERGARKVTRLPVSAPFHSPLMRPAREAMAELLAATRFDDPKVPVVSNVDALPMASGAAARDALIRQIDSPVRWVEVVEWMAGTAGVELFLEVGSGTVLSGLNRRIAPATRSASLPDPEQLEKLLASIAGSAAPGPAESPAPEAGGGSAGGKTSREAD